MGKQIIYPLSSLIPMRIKKCVKKMRPNEAKFGSRRKVDIKTSGTAA